MAQKNIHPSQHEVSVLLTNGQTIKIKTTWGEDGSSMRLDLDPFNHPAWKQGTKGFVNSNDERVKEFNKKYGDFGGIFG